jgi:hypothetical protein
VMNAETRHISAQAPSAETPDFVSDSLTLAAFLTLRGHQPQLRAAGRRVLFGFRKTTQLEDALRLFEAGGALVEPTAYDETRLDLRRRVERLLGGAR